MPVINQETPMGSFNDLEKHAENIKDKIKQEQDDWTRSDE
jgi:hypothetical protein